MMSAEESPSQLSLPWRVASASIMGVLGGLARVALYTTNSTEVHGLEEFQELVAERRDIEGRQRGLITGSQSKPIVLIDSWLIRFFTVSNHISMYVRTIRLL